MNDTERASAFVEAIARHEPDLALSMVDPARFRRHDPTGDHAWQSVPGYVAGLRDEPSTVTVVRGFQDGPFVVLHSAGLLDGDAHLFDVVRLDQGAIVEHWHFGAPAAPPNPGGHTQTDGPVEAEDLDRTEENKRTVRDYYEVVHLQGRHDEVPRYFDGDYCVRHEPGVADGVTAFARDLARLTQNRTIDRIDLLLGHGDFVFLLAGGSHDSVPCSYLDLYRVEHDKLVEHWGFPATSRVKSTTDPAPGS